MLNSLTKTGNEVYNFYQNNFFQTPSLTQKKMATYAILGVITAFMLINNPVTLLLGLLIAATIAITQHPEEAGTFLNKFERRLP